MQKSVCLHTRGTLQLYSQVSALTGQFYCWRQNKKTTTLPSLAQAETEFGAVAKAVQKQDFYYFNDDSINCRDSVVFKARSADIIKGLDITGPPDIPRQFAIKKGCREDIIVDSDSDEEEDELNQARCEEGGSDIGSFGDI